MAIRLVPGGLWPPGFLEKPAELEIKLQSKLYQPRIFHLGDLTELCSVGDVAVRIVKLRMVEDIEDLSSKFEVSPLVNRDVLHYNEIGIADSRPATDAARGIADSSKRARDKDRAIVEVVALIALRPLVGKFGDLIGLARVFEIGTVHQLKIRG